MDVLLSIVTVSLNAAAMIERTLASVALQQVNFGVEHICVDGGSTRQHPGDYRSVGVTTFANPAHLRARQGDFRRNEQGPEGSSGRIRIIPERGRFPGGARFTGVGAQGMRSRQRRQPGSDRRRRRHGQSWTGGPLEASSRTAITRSRPRIRNVSRASGAVFASDVCWRQSRVSTPGYAWRRISISITTWSADSVRRLVSSARMSRSWRRAGPPMRG